MFLNLRRMSLAFVIGMLAATPATADTVYVDATGDTPGSYTTIMSAVNTTATEIIVKNTGLYDEAVLITRSLTLRGEDPNNRPVVAPRRDVADANWSGRGFHIGKGSVDPLVHVSVSDFVVIPSLTSERFIIPGMSAYSEINTALHLDLNNILIAPNDGENRPLLVSKWDDPAIETTGTVTFRGGGILFSNPLNSNWGVFQSEFHGRLSNVKIIGCGYSHFLSPGIYYKGATTGSLHLSGVEVSGNKGTGLYIIGGNKTLVNGSRTSPGLLVNNNEFEGIKCENELGFDTVESIAGDHIVSVGNGLGGLFVKDTPRAQIALSDCLFAKNAGGEIRFSNQAGQIGAVFSLTNSTVFGEADPLLHFHLPTGEPAVSIEDSILAGRGGNDALYAGALTTVDIKNSALVLHGADALASVAQTSSTGVINLAHVIYEDPMFMNHETDPLQADSFDVWNSTYSDASSTSGPLNGWGDGPDTSGVGDWMKYVH